MRFLRVIALILIFVACAILGRDGLASLSESRLALLPLGELWFNLSPGSLNGLQAGVERYLSVAIWDAAIAPVLHAPAFVFPMAIGLILLLLSLRRSAR